MKKTLALMLAIVAVLALSLPVFAGQQQNQSDDNKDVAVTSEMMNVKINVTAPSTSTLILNPYGMKYTGGLDAFEGKTAQVLAPYVVFTNLTKAKLIVSGKFTPTIKGVSIVTGDSIAASESEKKAVLRVDFGMMKNEEGEFVEGGTPEKKTYKFPALTATSGDTTVGSGDGQFIELKSNISGDGTQFTLNPPEYPNFVVPETDGENPNYFGFQFDGNLTKAPDEVWTTADSINVAVALKFTPKALTDS